MFSLNRQNTEVIKQPSCTCHCHWQFVSVTGQHVTVLSERGSDAAFAISDRAVHFSVYPVVGGRRMRIRHEAFGRLFL